MQTREEFDGVIQSRLGEDFDRSIVGQVQFIFDAVWTAALALNATQGVCVSVCVHVRVITCICHVHVWEHYTLLRSYSPQLSNICSHLS